MSDNIFFPTFPDDGLDFSGPSGSSYFQEKRHHMLDPTITALDADGVAFHQSQEPGVQTTNQSFSCPYRKRNPWMFNVRDHHICATHSFPTIALLKQVHFFYFVPVVEAHETWCHFFQRLREHSRSMSTEVMMQEARVYLQPFIIHGQNFLLALGNTIRLIGRILSGVTQRSRVGRPQWLDEALLFSMSNTGN
ncbi:hypothetical protein CEP54_001985 [Fusarium duplospermum]|uniref:Uncharacterized protein n=1 Tax=Fusarium duplospermum TaxID=1325734 RepID=A0A428QXQ6_9HYPO|nr:hypothetical protein CEP54_001985 [Fusarium duplospermum]